MILIALRVEVEGEDPTALTAPCINVPPAMCRAPRSPKTMPRLSLQQASTGKREAYLVLIRVHFEANARSVLLSVGSGSFVFCLGLS